MCITFWVSSQIKGFAIKNESRILVIVSGEDFTRHTGSSRENRGFVENYNVWIVDELLYKTVVELCIKN